MAEPQDFTPLVIEDVALTLDGVDYATALDSVTLTPTSTKLPWKPVNGRKKNRVGKPAWSLALNLGQSFDRAGLTAKLIADHGKTVPFTLQPQGVGTGLASVTGKVLLEAGQIGGGAETVAVASVTLDIDDQPVFTWATGAVPAPQ